ncbi:hypothetical protein CP532_6110 [Ophiocordyceps camponoti-leonardi (nom. inval.)]|nr:hypothetical protein CP532_6110 [Ophiocordyceps camponoti-leonardi (nom. inval.)]
MLSRQARCGLVPHQLAVSQPNRATSTCSAPRVSTMWLGRSRLITRLSQMRDQAQERHGFVQRRLFATAVEQYQPFYNPSLPPLTAPPQYFDPHKPLILPDTAHWRSTTRINPSGIPGNIDDMLSLFHACISVGKLERAALVIKRCYVIGTLSPEEQILLNNKYLRASLDQIRHKPGKKQAEGLHKWYELQIRNKRLPQTAETVACMLKASLLSEEGSRLERLVKRYMDMAPGEAGLRVLNMSEILNDRDLAVITEICPTYNLNEEDNKEELLANGQGEVEEETPLPGAQDFPKVQETPQSGLGLASLRRGLSLFETLKDVDVSTLSKAEQHRIQLMLERDSIDAAIVKWRHDRKALQKAGITMECGSAKAGSFFSQNLAVWLDAMENRIEQELQACDLSELKPRKTDIDFQRCLYGPFLRQSTPERLAALTILTVVNLGSMSGMDRGVTVSRLVTNLARLVQEDIKLQRKEEARKAARKLKVSVRREAAEGQKAEALHKSIEELKGRLEGMGEEEKAETIQVINKMKRRALYIVQAQKKALLEGKPDPFEAKPLAELSASAQKMIPSMNQKPWSQDISSHVGSILLKILLETTKIKVTTRHPKTQELVSQYQPAFIHLQQPRKGKKVGVFMLNLQLAEKLKQEPIADFITKHLPMLVEPKPWTSFHSGGYLASETALVRVKAGNVEQTLYNKAAIETGDMAQVLKGLDILGKTAWRINENILMVMLKAWNKGDEIANIPPLNPKFDLPPEPDPSADPLKRLEWIHAVKFMQNKKMALHSQRCYMNLQLEIARAYRNQTMYYPHNVDYRGRAYPMPTYMNHMGADHVRGLLRFAKGRELGARGLRWLKIHLANVYGFDKSSFDERETFANDNMNNIMESVANPLDGSRWWLEAEDPWQCLAACFELKAAMDHDDPTKYVSHLPIHQDGTCNGLQHYAALGGDTWGAKQVNLEPSDRPADVYSAVADLVKKSIDKDAALGEPFAKALQGKVTRKVVKQTVMTNVYGVTFNGAKKQVCKQLDDLYPTLGKDNGTSNMKLSMYVARLTFKALATMFRGAHDIQYWLGEVGGRVCRALTKTQLKLLAEIEETGATVDDDSVRGLRQAKLAELQTKLATEFRSTIVWTTPLRMPVVQPYRKVCMREVRTCLQAVVCSTTDATDPVNRRKQLQGFPPNFIHSLDASHMVLSAVRCDELGLTFAAVHDSFWTHAADVDTMNGVLREAFIRIHQENVIERLAAEFEARHKGSMYMAHVDSLSEVGRQIRQLRLQTKLSIEEELVLEYRRLRLLSSGNEKDIAKGKTIVTPASIYEAMPAKEPDIDIAEDKKNIGIGEIPAEEEDEDAALLDEVLGEVLSEGEAEEAVEEDVPNLEDPEEAPTPKKTTKEKKGKKKTKSKKKKKGEEAGVDEEEDADAKNDGDVQKPPVKKRRIKGYTGRTLAFWMPLTIPPVPEKGGYDVNRLRQSMYFFS